MHQTLEFVVRHGYLLLFSWILVEQTALPLPSIPLLLACGALAKEGRLNPVLIVLYGVVACLAADNVWFYLGRKRGSRIVRLLCRLALEPDSCVRRTEDNFSRFGSRSLLISKFVPGLNAVAAPMAGACGVSLGRFLIFDAAGAVLWLTAYGSLGYIFSGQLEVVAAYTKHLGSGVGLLIVALFGAWIGWKFIQRQRFMRKLAIARITVEQLKRKLDAGEDVLVVDLRSQLEPEELLLPGVIRIPMEELVDHHERIPRDRDIVLYCSCPNEASSARVALLLKQRGITRVHPLRGGIEALRGLGLTTRSNADTTIK